MSLKYFTFKVVLCQREEGAQILMWFSSFHVLRAGADGKTIEASYLWPQIPPSKKFLTLCYAFLPYYYPLELKDITFLVSEWETVFLFADTSLPLHEGASIEMRSY